MPTNLLSVLQGRFATANAEADSITASAVEEDRELTQEEQTRYDAAVASCENVASQIAVEKRRAEAQQSAAVPMYVQGDAAKGGEPNILLDPKLGWKSFGEQAVAIHAAVIGVGAVDERLRISAAATTYGREGSEADGGFLVAPEFSSTISAHSLEQDAFLPLTSNDQISGNSMSFPADETTPWGSTGIRARWEGEAATATQDKPAGKVNSMRLNKLISLVPVTDELSQDSAILSTYLSRKTGEAIRWKTNDAIMNGTGAGMPAGIAGASATVEQAKVGSQTADTIVAGNITAMFARVLGPAQAVWVVNPDSWGQLPLMTIGDMPVWLANTTLIGAPAGTIFGRPVIMSDACQTLGDAGDIYLINFTAYQTITKAGGVEEATSIHLWFDQAVNAFRAIFRLDGQPWLASAVTPPNSTVTRSPFVRVAARA